MVDFPEGYGFAPGKGRQLMQETFMLVIGTFERRNHYLKVGRKTSPYDFTEIGVISKEANDAPIRGILLQAESMSAPIEGTLQQVVTALCTIHKLRGNIR
jgi:hypothetical protein